MAAKLSGLSELTIRAWENRYGVVKPGRTESGRRLYSEEDISKLSLLKNLTEYGFRIGNIAPLSSRELHELRNNGADESTKATNSLSHQSRETIQECIEAVTQFDGKRLYNFLNESALSFSQLRLIEEIILPLIEQIGQSWRNGSLRVAHEHFASGVIRKFLGNLSDGYQIPESAPHIIVATPEGQYHETGAMISMLLASSYGWRTTYLGTCLNAEELAAVARTLNCHCITLSIVYPEDDPLLPFQLKRLRELLTNEGMIIITGSSSRGYKNVLKEIGALVSTSIQDYQSILMGARKKLSAKAKNSKWDTVMDAHSEHSQNNITIKKVG